MSMCKSCGSRIVWVTMDKTGKHMPCDAEILFINISKGSDTFIASSGGYGTTITGTAVEGDPVPGMKTVKASRSHFATCPNADKHRKVRTK